jgi:hypothetical protein
MVYSMVPVLPLLSIILRNESVLLAELLLSENENGTTSTVVRELATEPQSLLTPLQSGKQLSFDPAARRAFAFLWHYSQATTGAAAPNAAAAAVPSVAVFDGVGSVRSAAAAAAATAVSLALILDVPELNAYANVRWDAHAGGGRGGVLLSGARTVDSAAVVGLLTLPPPSPAVPNKVTSSGVAAVVMAGNYSEIATLGADCELFTVTAADLGGSRTLFLSLGCPEQRLGRLHVDSGAFSSVPLSSGSTAAGGFVLSSLVLSSWAFKGGGGGATAGGIVGIGMLESHPPSLAFFYINVSTGFLRTACGIAGVSSPVQSVAAYDDASGRYFQFAFATAQSNAGSEPSGEAGSLQFGAPTLVELDTVAALAMAEQAAAATKPPECQGVRLRALPQPAASGLFDVCVLTD